MVFASLPAVTRERIDGVQTPNPTTFNGCLFVGNRAAATGGAIESAAGQDAIINTSFIGNIAGLGGALRLAGTAYLDNCSCFENYSDLDGGAAVSNMGFISSMTRISFIGNAFNCAPKMFLDYDPVSCCWIAMILTTKALQLTLRLHFCMRPSPPHTDTRTIKSNTFRRWASLPTTRRIASVLYCLWLYSA